MSAKTKVLFVIDYFGNPHAGTEGQLFNLVSGLDRDFVEPHLLVFQESPWLAAHGFPCYYTVLGHRSLSSPGTWFGLWRLAREFRSAGFRLAHVFFNDPSIICPPVFRLAGIRSLISRRDMGYWYNPSLKRLLRMTGRFAEGVIANSQAVRTVTCEAEGFPTKAVHVIYNGYPEDSGTQADSATPVEPLATLRKQGRLLVGLTANIRPIKRMQDAIAVLGLLRDTAPLLDLVIIGAGESGFLKEQAAHAGVLDRVHFLGAREDVKACLSYLDIGILCSESEGFSNAIVEYLQAGLPVVCSDVGGNPEAVREGENGFVFPMGDVGRFAEAVLKLASDPELREELGNAARLDAVERFDMRVMVNSHQALYRRLVDKAGAVEPDGSARDGNRGNR